MTRPVPRLLAGGAQLLVAGRRAVVERRAGTDARPILRLAGVAGREAAEALRGSEIEVERASLPELGEGEWWAHELEGMQVHDGPLLLGTVSRLMELPSCEALEVAPAGGGAPLLVPMVRDAVRAVDTAAGTIDVDASFLGVDGPGGG